MPIWRLSLAKMKLKVAETPADVVALPKWLDDMIEVSARVLAKAVPPDIGIDGKLIEDPPSAISLFENCEVAGGGKKIKLFSLGAEAQSPTQFLARSTGPGMVTLAPLVGEPGGLPKPLIEALVDPLLLPTNVLKSLLVSTPLSVPPV